MGVLDRWMGDERSEVRLLGVGRIVGPGPVTLMRTLEKLELPFEAYPIVLRHVLSPAHVDARRQRRRRTPDGVDSNKDEQTTHRDGGDPLTVAPRRRSLARTLHGLESVFLPAVADVDAR